MQNQYPSGHPRSAEASVPMQPQPQVPMQPQPQHSQQQPIDKHLPLYGATFGQAVKRFFGKYASFKGRASKREYWWAQLFLAIIAAPGYAGIAMGFLEFHDSIDIDPGMIIFLIGYGFIGWLVTLLPTIALTVRRFHDANKRGALVFALFGGIIAAHVLVFVVLFLALIWYEGLSTFVETEPHFSDYIYISKSEWYYSRIVAHAAVGMLWLIPGLLRTDPAGQRFDRVSK